MHIYARERVHHLAVRAAQCETVCVLNLIVSWKRHVCAINIFNYWVNVALLLCLSFPCILHVLQAYVNARRFPCSPGPEC